LIIFSIYSFKNAAHVLRIRLTSKYYYHNWTSLASKHTSSSSVLKFRLVFDGKFVFITVLVYNVSVW